jgi:tetratricopeptide (TPR) repeat protein
VTRRRLRVALLLLVVAAGLGAGGHVAFRSRRAALERRAAENAVRRRDFPSAHARLVAYLEVHPRDFGAELEAARSARRAAFTELFDGPRPELRDAAVRHLEACARLQGDPGAVALERALLRVQSGDLGGVEETFGDRLHAGGPDVPLILEALVHGHLRRLNLDRARAYADRLLELEPENVQALVWRGRIREQFGRVGPAREDYEAAVRLNPEFDPARFYLAENLLRANRADEAAAHLEALHARVPGNALVELARAQCRAASGDEAGARELLDAWLADNPAGHPRRLEALTERANLALAAGEPAAAEGFARQALGVAPLDQYALYALERALAGQGRGEEAKAVGDKLDRVKQDLRFVARAAEEVARSPDDLGLRQRIGEAYLRLGRDGEALVWLTGVLDRDPGYRPALRALADYYDRAGDARRAAAYRRRLETSGPAGAT